MIETLCVIAVIVVLVAIILPHLAGSRRAARRVTELAGAREMYGALTMYGRDYTDAFPFCATPGEIDGPLTLYGASFQGRFFTAQSKLFVNLLAPSYLSSTKELVVVDRDYNANSGMPPQVMQSEVWLTYTAFSRPSYWVGAQPPDGGTLLCGGRWSDVGFPSSKGLLLDLRTHNRQTTGQEPKEALVLWGIVWGDGSGVIRPVDVDHRYRTVVRPNAMFDWPVLATEEGLAGRDFEEPTPAPGPP